MESDGSKAMILSVKNTSSAADKAFKFNFMTVKAGQALLKVEGDFQSAPADKQAFVENKSWKESMSQVVANQRILVNGA